MQFHKIIKKTVFQTIVYVIFTEHTYITLEVKK